MKFDDHLKDIGVLPSPGKPRIREAVLDNERKARKFGREGLIIDDYHHKGLTDFDCSEYVPKVWLLQQYEEFSDKMYQSYLSAYPEPFTPSP